MIRTMRALLSIVLVAAAVHAEDATVLPCRPTIACTAQIEVPGLLTVEAGYLLRKLDNAGSQQSVPFLFKLSANDWLQWQLGSNGPTFAGGSAPARFFDDVTLGAKVRLLRTSSTALSVSATLSAPLPAQTGYLRTWDVFFIGYLSQVLPAGFSADLNLGLNDWRLGDGALLQPWGALAVNHDLAAGFTAMAEIYRFGSADPVAPRDSGVLAALSYQAASWLVLDGGADLGIVSGRSFSIFAGVTFSPVRL